MTLRSEVKFIGSGKPKRKMEILESIEYNNNIDIMKTV